MAISEARKRANKKYLENNKEKVLAWRRKYYRKKYREWRNNLTGKRLEEFRKKERDRTRKRDRKRRKELLEYFGNKCVGCNFDDWRTLQVDHINGGGNKERKKFKNTWHYTKHLLKKENRHKYQLLCANCNKIKQYENKEYGNVVK